MRLDGDDPYLVVAADKGTASFSDIANSISRNGFWLDDAFASGGSAGYDHKNMAITAWRVGIDQAPFREIGVDIQQQDFSVVGIGDMSSATYSATACRSRAISEAAGRFRPPPFSSIRIPMAISFVERERLFKCRARRRPITIPS